MALEDTRYYKYIAKQNAVTLAALRQLNVWGSRGPEFESQHSDQIRLIILTPLVLKLSTLFFVQNLVL